MSNLNQFIFIVIFSIFSIASVCAFQSYDFFQWSPDGSYKNGKLSLVRAELDKVSQEMEELPEDEQEFRLLIQDVEKFLLRLDAESVDQINTAMGKVENFMDRSDDLKLSIPEYLGAQKILGDALIHGNSALRYSIHGHSSKHEN